MLIPDRGQICCPRCGESLNALRPRCDPCPNQCATGAAANEQAQSPSPPSDGDRSRMQGQPCPPHGDCDQVPLQDSVSAADQPLRLRFDPPHPAGGCAGPAWNSRRDRLQRWFWRLGQAILAVGLAASACGVSLVVWSAYSSRPELWSVGIPISIAGQLAMLIALAFRPAGFMEHPAAGRASLVPPCRQIPGLRIDTRGHTTEIAPTQALLDLIARLEDLSNRLDR